MPRRKYGDIDRYMAMQASAIGACQNQTDKEMADEMGVPVRMWRRYRAGESQLQISLLYLRAAESVAIREFARLYIRLIFGL